MHVQQLKVFTRTKPEMEDQNVQGTISEAGTSRTLESQDKEAETDIKDIHAAVIHIDMVSEMVAEEDSRVTSSMDDQSHIAVPSEYLLMKSGKDLTNPPDVEEWEKSKEIHLMDTTCLSYRRVQPTLNYWHCSSKETTNKE